MFSRWCFHPSDESSSLIMLISVKSQLYPPAKHIKVGHVPWKLGIHMLRHGRHVWFPVSSHVTLNMSLAKPGTGAKFHHVCNPPLGRAVHRHHPMDGICTEFQVMWKKIPSNSHQNLRNLKMCISHPQNGTFTNLWFFSVSEVIGNMLGNNYWLGTWVWVNTYRYIFSGMNIHLPAILMFTRGTRFWHTATSLVILCSQQREMDLSEEWGDHPFKTSVYLSQGKFPDKPMFVVSGQSGLTYVDIS